MNNESFYPLTSKSLEKLYQANLTAAEWRLWTYLVVTDPWGDHYKDLPDTLTIMEKVGIKKSTFYAAIAKFQKFELFDFQDKGFAFRNLQGVPKVRNTVQYSGSFSEISESVPKSRKPNRKNGTLSKNLEKQSPEPLPDKDSEALQTLQTLQTKKDFFQTLSESEEREKKEILISESSFLQEKSEKEKAKAENIAFFNSLNGLQKEAIIRTAHKYFLPRLNQYPSLPLMWIKCHAIEIAHTDACNQEIDLIEAESEANSEAKYTLQDIQEMYPDCWKEILPYFGSLLAF